MGHTRYFKWQLGVNKTSLESLDSGGLLLYLRNYQNMEERIWISGNSCCLVAVFPPSSPDLLAL